MTVAMQGGYGKPRPALIVQSKAFETLGSVTFLPLTSDVINTAWFRVPIYPTAENGLERPSQVMADKCITMPVTRVGKVFGQLDNADIARVDQALAIFLGFA